MKEIIVGTFEKPILYIDTLIPRLHIEDKSVSLSKEELLALIRALTRFL